MVFKKNLAEIQNLTKDVKTRIDFLRNIGVTDPQKSVTVHITGADVTVNNVLLLAYQILFIQLYGRPEDTNITILLDQERLVQFVCDLLPYNCARKRLYVCGIHCHNTGITWSVWLTSESGGECCFLWRLRKPDLFNFSAPHRHTDNVLFAGE